MSEETTPREDETKSPTQEPETRGADQRRLLWAAALIVALALFAGGYAIGQANDEASEAIAVPGLVTDDMIDGPMDEELLRLFDDLERDLRRGLDRGGFRRFGGPEHDLVCSILEEDGHTLMLECDSVPSPGHSDEDDGDTDDDPVTDEAGFLGVRIVETDRGVSVAEVLDGSPARDAGLEPNDVIVAFDGTPIDSAEQLSDLVSAAGAGSDVSITVRRFEAEITVQVTLSEPFDQPEA